MTDTGQKADLRHEGAVPLRRPGDYPCLVCRPCARAAGKAARDGERTLSFVLCDVCAVARWCLPPAGYGDFTADELRRMRLAAQQRQGGG
jgi:hypothetical protein